MAQLSGQNYIRQVSRLITLRTSSWIGDWNHTSHVRVKVYLKHYCLGPGSQDEEVQMMLGEHTNVATTAAIQVRKISLSEFSPKM